jgi:aconitase B
VERDEGHAQREALERLQSEMREHVADAVALADRIAALQLRIDIALAELTKPSNSTTAE